ncbi:MAG TPA: flavin reductase family protein [Acidobacteriaceae bacterium]|nr:flavin reductase family protein [Acidobacteriaceae bacterium]
MNDQKMLKIDPSEHPVSDIYQLLVGSVVPRPIAFVSTVDADGVRNLAPFSYFTVCSANPPVIAFCPAVREGPLTTKDTLRNIIATREFVVNIVSEHFAEQMNATSASVPPEVDEFALSGLTPIESDLVTPARVGESHVQMECKLLQIVHVSDKPGGGSIVLGEVLRFHVREGLGEGCKIDPDKLKAIGRMAGSTYARTTDRFDLPRPR